MPLTRDEHRCLHLSAGEVAERSRRAGLHRLARYASAAFAFAQGSLVFDDASMAEVAAVLSHDKTFYSSAGYSDYGNFYGEPRSYTVSLRGTFQGRSERSRGSPTLQRNSPEDIPPATELGLRLH